MKKLLIITATLIATNASAEDSYNFYGSSGDYLGGAISNGDRIIYHGSSGQLEGSSTTVGDQTNFYGSSGQYLGSVHENNPGYK